MKIAIQGVKGSFHALVAEKLFGSDVELVCCDSFNNVFIAVRDGDADQAVVACENSLYGSIREVYDLLLKHRFPIIGEHTEHIHQQLIGHKHTKLDQIKEVYSHPVALNQCRNFLERKLPGAELIEHDDTASSVEYIKDKGTQFAAAIASNSAAELYEMTILASDIEDEKTNLTRFIVMRANQGKTVSDPIRAMFVLTTPHTPGALYHALGVLNDSNVNLTKLESRPIRGEAFRYQFLIDADIKDIDFSKVTRRLLDHDNKVDILGLF